MADTKVKKKGGLKNYLILAAIFLAGIGLTFYLCNLYKVYDEYQKQTPVIRDTLSEITADELEHYILENPTIVIYMCTSSDMVCRNYENGFKKIIKSKELQDEIVYLNLSDLDQQKFIEDFNNKYNFKVKLTTLYPSLVVFEDGKIASILQGNVDEELTVVKTKQFIEIHKIGE